MAPAYTDRAHFFLFELSKGEEGFSIQEILKSLAFSMVDSSEWVDKEIGTRIRLFSSSSMPEYFGGCILPSHEITKQMCRLARAFTWTSRAFDVLFLLFIAEWLIGLLVFVGGLSVFLSYIGILIAVTFLCFLINAIFAILLFFYLDRKSTHHNIEIAHNVIRLLLEGLAERYRDGSITAINICTKLGNRSIAHHLPREFIEKMKPLGVNHLEMDARIWESFHSNGALQ